MLLPDMRLNEIMTFKELPEQVLVTHEMWTCTSPFLTIEISHVIKDLRIYLEQGSFLAGQKTLRVHHRSSSTTRTILAKKCLFVENVTRTHLRSDYMILLLDGRSRF